MNFVAHRSRPASGQPFAIAGLSIGAVFSGLIVFFIGGEILSDPGGVQGLVMVALWLSVPLILTVLALLRPAWAYVCLVGVVAAIVIASIVRIPLAEPIWEFEDTHGPVSLMVLIGVLLPPVALGRAMPLQAGWLMVIAIGGSLIFESISLVLVEQASVILVFIVVMMPFALSAIFFILAGRSQRARRDSNPQPTG